MHVSVCVNLQVLAVVEKENRLMKSIRRPERVQPPVCKCHSTPLPVWCAANVQFASVGIRGPLLNCMADSHRLSNTNTHTPWPAQRPFLKSLPPFNEPSGMHVICPRSRLNLPALQLRCHLLEARSPGVGTTLCHSTQSLTLARVAVRPPGCDGSQVL